MDVGVRARVFMARGFYPALTKLQISRCDYEYYQLKDICRVPHLAEGGVPAYGVAIYLRADRSSHEADMKRGRSLATFFQSKARHLPLYLLNTVSLGGQSVNSVKMSSIAAEKAIIPEPGSTHSPGHEQDSTELQQVERIPTSDLNLVYDDNDEEPELHARTYFALVAMFILNLVQVVALQGPPAVVRIIKARLG
jgi:hypothetical protein